VFIICIRKKNSVKERICKILKGKIRNYFVLVVTFFMGVAFVMYSGNLASMGMKSNEYNKGNYEAIKLTMPELTNMVLIMMLRMICILWNLMMSF